MPVMKSLLSLAPKDGGGSMSASAMSATALTASTTTPRSFCSPFCWASTITMQLRGVTSLRARLKRTARSITGTTRPRRLMMPRMNSGIIGTSVVARYSMISLIETIATPKSSPVTEKVRYCWPLTACRSCGSCTALR